MGRSVGNKKNLIMSSQPSSKSFHKTGCGESETPAIHISQQYQKKNQTFQRNSVKNLIEKLKYFRPHHEDILKLESVKTVISALGEEEGEEEENFSKNGNKLADSILQGSSNLGCSNPQASKHTTFRGESNIQQHFHSIAACDQSDGGGGDSSDNFVMSKFIREGKSQESNNKSNMMHSSIDSSVSGVHSSSADPAGISPVTSSVVYAKQGFATLIQNFEYFYKRVAKKYFFMLRPRKPSKSNFFGVFFSILAFIFYYELHTINGFSRLWLKWENVDLSSVECTIESPNLAMELFRPPVLCAICHDVKSVDKVSGISPAEFERVYAYTGRPVIVTDAMTNWTAPTSFSFEFFKGIYNEGSRSLVHLDEDCLFFPYQTEFGSLAEVFNMTKERSQRSWYIGWSNCDAETSHILRHHYQRPYFLPETAESTHADWIFMGTPGHGAHMHIDHVINPSWQGQIKGFKRWHLQPPPECLYECHSFHVDVHPGDIIVLDTNKWYHQTEILPGENSITIGSEYD